MSHGHDLSIDLLSTTLVGVDRTADAHRRLGATAQAVVDDLPRALARTPLPSGLWFIRELDLALGCGELSRLPELVPQWAQAIVDVLSQSISTDPRWIHFESDVDLLATFVVSTVADRNDDDWMWVQAGLVDSPAYAVDSAVRIPVALSRRPHAVLPGLIQAVARCGVPGIDRALGVEGWTALAIVIGATYGVSAAALDGGTVVPSDAAAQRSSAAPTATQRARMDRVVMDRPEADRTEAEQPASDRAADPGRAGSYGEVDRTVADWTERDQAVADRAVVLVGRSSLAVSFLKSRLRPDLAVATAWAWLIVYEVEPALASAPSGQPTVAEIARQLLERLATDEIVLAPTHRDPHNTIAPEEIPDSRPASAAAITDRGDSDSSDRSAEQSRWAGLLFLLATSAHAGLPGCVRDDPALSQRGVQWTLWQVGQLLTRAAGDEPAVLALAGLSRTDVAKLLDGVPATDAEQRRVALLAARWRRITVARLQAAACGTDDLPSPAPARLLDWLIHRGGHIVATPGWVEVVLPGMSVELAIRSAGLDLDPGFVPWLGTVVTFRYE
ncbi:hypothetical protein EV645_6517 [Kribbella rubisoli]|uniref:Uncharacterized protein n=1 Tax=Kribbella rubisoli TaxID=3075929 RepID=A0A4Q7WMP3_9ACTN|nr:hypothetical protein [Kribbella rubisoli]RZU11351.1 hypothetical protein EV645_6517 [Kribbella rubisoli]